MEILYRGIAYVAEILPRGLLHKSSQENSSRELVQRFHTEILYRDLARTPLMETLVQRHCIEI